MRIGKLEVVRRNVWRFGTLGPLPARITRMVPYFLAGKRVYTIPEPAEVEGRIFKWRVALGPFEVRWSA